MCIFQICSFIDKELLEVRKHDGWLYFPYKEATIVGTIQKTSSRITLNDVKKIISENNGSSAADIVKKISEIQPPDQVGGSGITSVHFFLDDDGYERIIATDFESRCNKIVYGHLDEHGKLSDDGEVLYVEKYTN